MKKLLFLFFASLAMAANGQILFNKLYYQIYNGKTAIVTGYEGYPDNITIPSYVDFDGRSYVIKGIASHAFYNCSSLKSITIPVSITHIGEGAFAGCSNLKSINIPESITKIEESVFEGCSSLSSITLTDSLTSIGKKAFKDCSSLKSISIPKNVTWISENAFEGCELMSLYINSSYIYTDTYEYDSEYKFKAWFTGISINEVTFGENVKEIPENVFYYCELGSINIPKNVELININAFKECRCSSLYINCSGVHFLNLADVDEVTLGENVKIIGKEAFYGYDSLSKVYIYGDMPETGNNAFGEIGDATLYVLGNLLSDYQDHSEYRHFRHIRPIITDLGQIRNDKRYEIHTRNKARGSLCYYIDSEGGHLASTNPAAERYKFDEASSFAILRSDFYDSYLLYTLEGFVTSYGNLTEKPTAFDLWTLTKNSDGYFMFKVTNTGNVLNVNNNPGIQIVKYDTPDDGNQFTIIEIEDDDEIIDIPAFADYLPDYLMGKTFRLNCWRGYVGFDGNNLYGTTKENASEFAIIKYEGTNYLYDATHLAFVIHSTNARAGTTGNLLQESYTDFSNVVIGLKWGETGFGTYPVYLEDCFGNWLNMDSSTPPYVFMNTWQDFERGYGGNTYQIEVVNNNFNSERAIYMLETNPILVNSISLNYSTWETYTIGDKCQLTVTIKPDKAKDKSLTWTSSDESVATVDASGIVTAVGYGNAIITATANDGSNQSASCTVYVNSRVFRINLDHTEIILIAEGETVQLNATVYPDNATDMSLTWTSSNESVATVDVDGIVTAVGDGNAIITATANDGSNRSASCTVIVPIKNPVLDGLLYTLDWDKMEASVARGKNDYLSVLEIPESIVCYGKDFQVTSIGDRAFESCTSLTSVTVPYTVTQIGDRAFSGCSKLTNITIPASVTSIGASAFSYCRKLTSIAIPNSVTYIGGGAFYYCEGLTTVIIPNSVTTLGASAFSNCSNLAIVTLGKSVIAIEGHTFYECRNLTSIAIPNSVTTIGERAFYNCNNLTSLTLGTSITNIGNAAFAGCNSLNAIYISDLAAWCNIIYVRESYGSSSQPLVYARHLYLNGKEVTDLKIPEGITNINDDAFSYCEGLTSVTIPESVTSIGRYAFSYCAHLTDVYCYAEQIPNTASNTFEGSGFETATLHVPSVSIGAYRQVEPWSNFGTIVPIGGNGDDDIIIDFTDANVKVICVANWDTNGDGELSKAEAASVMDLGMAFNNTEITSLDELKYFTGLTNITSSTFSNCRNLTSVTIPKNVTYIDEHAFYWCFGLALIIVEGENPIYDSRDNCNAIIETATNTLVVGCKNTIIPNDVASIGYYAFADCSNLTTVAIPESVTSIGNNAFEGCNSLTSIDIPVSVTSIGAQAFRSCDYLSSVIISETVTDIGDGAFEGCGRLADVYCYAEQVPNTASNAFEGSSFDAATLHVPATFIDAYRSTEPWGNFGNIVGIGTPDVTVQTFTLACARGFVGSRNGYIRGTSIENASEFAIIDYEGTNYLYDVTSSAFVIHSTDARAGTNGNYLRESSTDFSKAVTGLSWGETGIVSYPCYLEDCFGNWLNMDSSTPPYVFMNTWQDFEGGNGGNTYQIGIVNDSFNPADAIAMLDNYFQNTVIATYAQYEAALGSIATNTQCCIYTIYDGTQYYLTHEGYLTEEPREDCIFTFYQTEGNNLYRTPGWKLQAYFTNPILSNGSSGDLMQQGHLLTDAQKRDNWDGQVWYLGDNNCYAVRATNAKSDEWGAQTYWTVLDTDSNGQPEAGYSWTPDFIWQIEHDQDFIDGIIAIENSKMKIESYDEAIYNLVGQRVNKLQQGINIKGGKKVIVHP